MSEPTSSFPVLAPPSHEQVWIVPRPRTRWWLYVLFFALTLLSTTLVGTHMEFNFSHRQQVFAIDDDPGAFLSMVIERPSLLLLGLPFSLTLMLILLAHEMGHYLYARHYRVYATPPFFIPFPSLFGTLGAFIRIKSPIPSRDALFDIGIAGPIAGFIPACVAVFGGIALSHHLAAATSESSVQLGFLPLIFHVAARLLQIRAPLASLSLHPIAAAGWIGMFATAMNLLPGGQLDGGHIVYALFPRLHRAVSLLTVFALVLLSKHFWVGWLLWSVVLFATSYHPPLPSRSSLSGSRQALAAFGLVMLTLAFTPNPFAGASGRKVWQEDLRPYASDALHWAREAAGRSRRH